MTKPCIKKLPERVQIDEWNICKCGHGDFQHESDYGFMGLGKRSNVECELCTCEKYNEIGIFTWHEWKALEECKE